MLLRGINSGLMKHYTEQFTLETTEPLQFIDITGEVKRVFERSGVTRGLVNVFTGHTTTAIKINERCDRLQMDMKKYLHALVPPMDEYHHNEGTVDGRANAHSHLMSLMMNASETVPVVNGELKLGSWQSVFFVELDGPRDVRTATINVIGE